MAESTDAQERKDVDLKPATYITMILGGVLLPAFTLCFELWTKLCAMEFFDPVPSLWHVLVVALVPLANAHLLWSIHRKNLQRITFLAWVSALSCGAAIFYSLFFLPVAPLSMIGILVYGLGFLPLSPMTSLATGVLIRNRIRERVAERPFTLRGLGLLTGFLIIVGVIAISEARFIVTRYGLEKATSADVQKQEDGLAFLRSYGDSDYILQLSGSRRQRVYLSDIVISLLSRSSVSPDVSASEIYYRLTGKAADSVAAPDRLNLFDFDDGEERFWQRQEISLVSSQMDGSIDNNASLGYLEWTFSLKNDNKYRALEGFTQIQLPPNAVVSRLTLWIDGEEREAAFAERTKVAHAYEQVTAKKRDPVLVTTAGRDRVNLKCYPIPQNGGEMKMRIGITFPLILEDKNKGLIRLPYFRDRNFKIPSETKHLVWLESKQTLESANKSLAPDNTDKVFGVRGSLTDAELLATDSTIRAAKPDDVETVWANDGNSTIEQRVKVVEGTKPTRYVFAVDTSESMRAERDKVIATLGKMAPQEDVALVLSNGNALNRDISFPNSFKGTAAEAVEKLKSVTFGGGVDNLPALTKAWDIAAEKDGSVVIWIHAPQPMKFSTSNDLSQKIKRRPNNTSIYSLSTGTGLDVVEKELDGLNFLLNVPRFGDVGTDLERLIGQLNNSTKKFTYERTKVAKKSDGPSVETSKHLVRLWANDEVGRILATEENEKAAVELAMKNQLVTPVTGAVVLETQAQYDQFGLKPVDKSTVPTIPEPETYLLIAVVFGILLWCLVTRKFF